MPLATYTDPVAAKLCDGCILVLFGHGHRDGALAHLDLTLDLIDWDMPVASGWPCDGCGDATPGDRTTTNWGVPSDRTKLSDCMGTITMMGLCPDCSVVAISKRRYGIGPHAMSLVDPDTVTVVGPADRTFTRHMSLRPCPGCGAGPGLRRNVIAVVSD